MSLIAYEEEFSDRTKAQKVLAQFKELEKSKKLVKIELPDKKMVVSIIDNGNNPKHLAEYLNQRFDGTKKKRTVNEHFVENDLTES